MPRDGLSDGVYTIAEAAQMTGWIACYPTNNGPGTFQPQTIPKHFNGSLVQKWLSACREFHHHTSDASVSVPYLFLIDCETLQLCRASRQTQYVALSYVWGKSVTTDVTLPNSSPIGVQQHLPPADSLSQVVKDSISVTKQIGFRYLWIDKYCINQRDAAVKNEQIENMDLIYSCAELTIIAAAGEDEGYGLPGVGVERLASPTFEIGNVTFTHMPTEPWVVTRHSKWASRGWTFQEEKLSRRRLYFSDTQVFFSCDKMLCYESRGGAEYAGDSQRMKTYSTASLETSWLDTLVFMAQNKLPPDNTTPTQGFLGSVKERLRGCWGVVNDYSARNLTYDSDALRAFAGVLRVFEEGEYPIYSIQGLPVASSSGLVSALCWDHHEPERSHRRTGFPSWSWAGWTREIKFPSGLESSPEFEIDSQSIMVEYEDGHKLDLKELDKALASTRLKTNNKRHAHIPLKNDQDMLDTEMETREFYSPKMIQLHAPVITAESFSFADPTNWENGTFAGMKLSIESGPLRRYSMPFTPIYLLNGLAAGTLDCVLLRVDRDELGRSRAHLLLLQQHGVWETHRIGKIMAIKTKNGSLNLDELLGKLEWRNIRLV